MITEDLPGRVGALGIHPSARVEPQLERVVVVRDALGERSPKGILFGHLVTWSLGPLYHIHMQRYDHSHQTTRTTRGLTILPCSRNATQSA